MKEVISKIDRSKYRSVFSDGKHEVIGDEPAPYGTDEGTNPYSILLMA
jgi:putative redox protein